MKARDSKGRFSRSADGGLILAFPTLNTILYWCILIVIFLPWFLILSKFNLLTKISMVFDSIFKDADNPEINNKKNGLFY